MTRTYRKFTKEFKLQAIQQMELSDKPVTQIARELDIRVNQIYKWKRQMTEKADKAFSKTLSSIDVIEQDSAVELKQEIARLRKENIRLKADRDILKKAAAYFAQEAVSDINS